ncbi:MAG: pyruvate kinase [Planctomycetes bacterium]|nr:pyruvate kinase [Planctomycetota bacterium]
MPAEPLSQRARTKIVATVGPASRGATMLAELIAAGVDVFRINTAHGDRAEHQQAVSDIREASQDVGRPVGILVDLAGPKIRLGELFQDPMECEEGAEFRFIRGDSPAGRYELTSTYPQLIDELDKGDRVLLADGAVGMKVVAKTADAAVCRVEAAGEIRSRKGINLPGVKLSTPALTDADRDNARWAAETEADFVSLSFVRSPDDLSDLKSLLRDAGSDALVIAKIEKPEALDRLDEIVHISDGVMVARGDLGVEIDVAETPAAQKRIIAACTKLQKPVIVATQMLESMIEAKRPTRAEATDVANAILDGADACMLSGETAVGRYPRETVRMMNRILLKTEQLLRDAPPQPPPVAAVSGVHPITSAVVYGAARIASQLFASLVVVVTRSGATARVKAKQRDFIPTLAISDSPATLRRMCLFWGITPLPDAPAHDPPELRRFIDQWGIRDGCLRAGDRVVFVTGSALVESAHNVVVVHEVEEPQ